jgi:hypothetical protein
VTGLLPGQEYACTAVLADPYENLTAMAPVAIRTEEISAGTRLKDSLIEIIKGIHRVEPK